MKTLTYGVSAVLIANILPSAGLSQTSTLTCGQPYTIVSGDTLSGISARAYGSTDYVALHQSNLAAIGPNPNRIMVGQRIDIPCFGETPNVVAAVEIPAVEAPATATPVSDVADTEVAEAADDTLVFTFNKTSAPKFVINSGIIDPYLAEITEVTEGRVQFVDPDTMNRDPMVQLDLVASGEIDATYVFNGYLADSHPLLQLPMLPLMGGSAEQTATAMWTMHEAHLAGTDYFDDAQLLGFVAAPAAHIWRLSDEPVVLDSNVGATNDYPVPYFAGLDTRGPKAVRAETAEMLAAYDEANTGTRTYLMAHGAARAAGVWSDDRTVTEVDYGIYTPTFSVVLSNEAWAQISPEDQAAIMEISGMGLAERSASWDAFDNGHRLHMIETGLNVTKASDAFIEELKTLAAIRMAPWMEAAASKGVDAKAAIQTYIQTQDALQDRLIYR